VKLFHNDADCRQSVKHYPDLGINLYNPGIHLTMNELHRVTGHRMTILGNIPPRDVLASGTPDEVRAAVRKMVAETENHGRVLASCAGGMPPSVSTANLRAFIDGGNCIRNAGIQRLAVQIQEHAASQERYALVAVHERVVLGKPESIRGC
jgi:uroporphyrinogen-III decarboxylase